MMKKYELSTDHTIKLGRRTLYRIKALIDFNNVKKGDLGGYIEGENNLSHDGNCWVYDNAMVFGTAVVFDNATVHDNAAVNGYAIVRSNAIIAGNAIISESALFSHNAYITNQKDYMECGPVDGRCYVTCYFDASKKLNYAITADVYGQVGNFDIIKKLDISDSSKSKLIDIIKCMAQLLEK